MPGVGPAGYEFWVVARGHTPSVCPEPSTGKTFQERRLPDERMEPRRWSRRLSPAFGTPSPHASASGISLQRLSQLDVAADGRYLVALSGGLCDPLIRGCSTPRIRQRVRVVGVGSAGCPCAASTLSTRRQRVASIPATGAGTSSNRRAASLLPAAGHRLARPLARVAPSVAPKPVRDCSTGR